MKVVIFGSGRSGTTSLYVLAQEIMLKNCKEQTDFYYEPFLRDKHTFNGLYRQVIGKSDLMNSLSFEGIFNHLLLPLLIDKPDPYRNNLFLHHLLNPGAPDKSLLIKFIRANGRFPLLEKICPQCRWIYIIRNPADVVNSILKRFSFYGGEFHRDDFPRFIDEINRVYNLSLTRDDKPLQLDIHKELLFWYYTNRFALESIKKSSRSHDVLILCHEEYVKNRELYTKKICRHLNTTFDPAFLQVSKKTTGPVTEEFQFSRQEFIICKDYLKKYIQLLEQFGIDFTFNEKDIFNKYTISEHEINRKRPFYGLHTRALARKYRALLKLKEEELAAKDETIENLAAQLRQLESLPKGKPG